MTTDLIGGIYEENVVYLIRTYMKVNFIFNLLLVTSMICK